MRETKAIRTVRAIRNRHYGFLVLDLAVIAWMIPGDDMPHGIVVGLFLASLFTTVKQLLECNRLLRGPR